jgi:hypothetical protein
MPGYYEAKSMIVECGDCDWTGPGGDLKLLVAFEALAEYGCPQCGAKITNLAYPTWVEVREAAQAGDPEAQEQLADVEKAAARARRAEKQAKSPVLAPEALDTETEVRAVLTMDGEEMVGDGPSYVLLANGLELQRELAFFEDREPMTRLLGLMRERYGDRLVSFDYHRAVVYLCGDRLRCRGELAEMVSDLRDGDGRRLDPAAAES